VSPELEKMLTKAALLPLQEPEELKAQLLAAKETVAKVLSPSPFQRSHWLSEKLKSDVWLKYDNLTPNGSFKVRGAVNAIAKRLAKRGGEKFCVVAASAGNHAQGVAFAAAKLGLEAHIFLPKRAPLVKREATARLGAKVYTVGETLEESFEAALEFASQREAEFVHAFNDVDVIYGQGVCLLECFDQFEHFTGKSRNEISHFVCSLGGGGLVAGATLAMNLFGSGEVIGVEQEVFDSAVQTLRNFKQSPLETKPTTTLADGIAVQLVGNLAVQSLLHFNNRLFTVSEDEIAAAILCIIERERVVVEGAGAAAVAGLLKHPNSFEGKTVVVSLSGGNIDPQMLARVIGKGLGLTGRMTRIVAKLSDRPGGLAHLLQNLAEVGANVLEIHHDRTYSKVNVGSVEVEIALETRDFSHQYEVLQALGEAGFACRIIPV
jgi:threonine dehydratase